MGGDLHLSSKPNEGTTLKVFLPYDEANDQLILDSPIVKIVYLEEHSVMIANWKRKINAGEFRELFNYLLHLMKQYELKHWVANILNANNDEEELNQVRKRFSQKISDLGLQKMALVASLEELTETEIERRKALLKKIYPFEMSYFRTLEDALSWIKNSD